MSEQEECGTCHFWLQVSEIGGCCRRYPPLTPMRATMLSAAESDVILDYPRSSSLSWCGEWRAKP